MGLLSFLKFKVKSDQQALEKMLNMAHHRGNGN